MSKKPLHVVLVVANEMLGENNEKLVEIFSQGNATLKRLKKQLNPKYINLRNTVFCLNSPKRSIALIKDEIQNSNNTIYIVGHHEEFGKIGLYNSEGLSSEILFEKMYELLGEKLMEVKTIHFFVCNTAYHPIDSKLSYCGKFLQKMQKYGVKDIQIIGYVGYIWEDKKHLYVTDNYGSYDKKIRAEERMVIFQ